MANLLSRTVVRSESGVTGTITAICAEATRSPGRNVHLQQSGVSDFKKLTLRLLYGAEEAVCLTPENIASQYYFLATEDIDARSEVLDYVAAPGKLNGLHQLAGDAEQINRHLAVGIDYQGIPFAGSHE